jgi:hypothetical protein
MPVEVLMLFTETGLIDRTARQLIRLQGIVGPTVLAQRTKAISKDGKSWTEIVQLLDGQAASPPKGRRAPVTMPLLRAARYAEGVANNEWSTLTEASKQTGWNKSRLSEALSVAKLPTVITDLFDAKRFSTENALDLLAIVRLLGVSKVVRHARLLGEQPPGRRSVREILNSLVGGDSAAECDVTSSPATLNDCGHRS